MTNPSPGRAHCEVCGRPLSRNNTSGICSGIYMTQECKRVRAERQRRANGVRPMGTKRKKCAHPDGCNVISSKNGYCAAHAGRLDRTGELGPVDLILKPIEVLAGTVFGKWTALEDYDVTDRRVLCRCACGTEKRVTVGTLRNGTSRSCGCAKRKRASIPFSRAPYIQPGEVYGRLTVLEPAPTSESLVLCRCECGNEGMKRARTLKNGNTRSCGCLRKKHGLSKHPLYSLWVGMVGRTTRPSHRDFPDWGGRGVTVCERWQGAPEGFLNFVADMGTRPGPDYSVDRWPDNSGPYAPGNTRWATPKEQSANTRTVADLERKLADVTAERDALAAELARVSRLLASRKRGASAQIPEDALF